MKMESTFWLSLGSLADVSNSSMLWESANFSAMLEGTWKAYILIKPGKVNKGLDYCAEISHSPVFGPQGHTCFPPGLEVLMLRPDGHYTPRTQQMTAL